MVLRSGCMFVTKDVPACDFSGISFGDVVGVINCYVEYDQAFATDIVLSAPLG